MRQLGYVLAAVAVIASVVAAGLSYHRLRQNRDRDVN